MENKIVNVVYLPVSITITLSFTLLKFETYQFISSKLNIINKTNFYAPDVI
jgi:hypothetical protein